MYQLIFTLLISSAIFTQKIFAAEMKDYETFQSELNKVYEIKKEKILFIEEFKKLDQSLNNQYKEFVKKEKKKLTLEGNQMALDLEYLEPLRILAAAQADKKSCQQAKFTNELNNSDEEKIFKSIKEQIELICKE